MTKNALRWFGIVLFLWVGGLGIKAVQGDAPTAEVKKDQAELIATVERNVQAMNEKDLETYLKDIYPDPKALEQTRKVMLQIFAVYTLAAVVEKIEFVQVGKEEASAKVVQVTRKVKGPAFRNNRATMLFSFKRHKGAWKIVATKPLSVDFLKD